MKNKIVSSPAYAAPPPPLSMRLYSRLLRLLPLAGGLTKLSFNRWTNSVFFGFKYPAETRMLNGLRIIVQPADHDGRVLYLFGTNDPKVHHVCQALLRDGDRFLDIGANYGSIGLLTAEKVGPTGQVHLFEPQPNLCHAIQTAITNGKLSNVTLHQVGLLDRDDEMQLSRPKNHSGMATLVRHGDQSKWDTLTVPVKNIATYLPQLIEDAPFGAKLDVEGAEVDLLPWLLNQPNLKFIVFEAARNQEQLFNMVRKARFMLYGLDRTIFRKQLRRVNALEQMKAFHDLVAVRLPEASTPGCIGTYALGRLVRDHH